MIQREQQMIRTAIIALLVVLALVYLLVYSIYYRPGSQNTSDTLTGSDSPQTVQSVTQQLVNTVQEVITTSSTETWSATATQVVISKDTPSSDTSSPTTINPGSSGLSAVDVVTASTTSTDEERILPDTLLTTDTTIADEIGVDYRYTLRDAKGIYYLNLGSSTQDLWALLQGQWWNTFALTTATKILANQLFGSRVVFLNLSQYLNQTVLMVVTVGSERWLIQIPYDIYHESKSYLAERFN